MRIIFTLLLCPWVVFAARPFRGGVVATAHPLASEAALAMLNEGGNAVDAAVAASLVLGVVTPYSCGIGGGGFAVIHDAVSGKDAVLDFREKAPAKATSSMYLDAAGKPIPSLSTDGALSVAIPGAVAGYLGLSEKYGRLSTAKVFAPAIRAAREGFWVSPRYQENVKARLQCLRSDAEAAKTFLRPNASGEQDVPEIGTRLTQLDLGRTLAAISSQGSRAFYQGRIARAMAQTVAASKGILTEKDLREFRPSWRAPLEGTYRGHAIVTVPPPSAGGLAVVQTLAMLEAGAAPTSFRSVAFLHRLVESWRRVYADRVKYLGDPAFVKVPLPMLISAAHLRAMGESIQPDRATPSAELLPTLSKTEPAAKRNTSHISVIDREGNAVSLTTTINYYFGSCMVVPGTGILLNDEMDDFAVAPMVANAYGLVTGAPNTIAPGKTPLSSMAPTLVFQKDNRSAILMSVGSPGGSTIPTTVIQVISDVLDFGMDVTRAVGLGRIHHQYMPDAIRVDRFGLEDATETGLKSLHHTTIHEEKWGDAEAVMVDPRTGLHYAASDPRNEGLGTGQD